MITTPKVTVLMPVYNGETYLHEAMDSILNQTFTDFEFLIIDDGSVDSSVEIIKSYDDPRIKLELNGNNLGLIATLNKGLIIAKGEYIARMDCDDISMPKRLEKQVAFMESHSEVGVCGTWFKSFTDTWSTIVAHPTDTDMIKSKLFFDTYLGHPTVIMRMSLFKKYDLHYDPAHLHAEDYGLWVKCSFLFPLANLPEVLLHHRDSPSSITQVHRSKQIMTVTEINISNLARLGITELDSETLALHQKIVFNSDSFNNHDLIIKANNWLLKLQAANNDKRCYPEPCFSLVLAEKWHEICSWARRFTSWGHEVYLESTLNPEHSIHTVPFVEKVTADSGNALVKFTIDVVIPAYNCEAFITDTVLSAISQTYLPQQIIIVDDGSTDKTSELIKKMVQVQNLPVAIKYIRQENRGLSAARNTGIRSCTAHYIAFLDADDHWEENKLEKQVAVFQNSEFKNLGVVYCDYSNIDATGSFMDFPCFVLDKTVRGNVFEQLLRGNLIAGSGSAVLAKKECFDKVGLFDENLPSCEDWDMWIRIADAYDFDFAEEKLVRLRRHTANMSKNERNMLIGKIMVFNKISAEEIPDVALQLLRYQLICSVVNSYNKGEYTDFTKYMNNSLRGQIYTS